MRSLFAVVLALSACVSEGADDPIEQASTHMVLTMCGEEPTLPQLHPFYETRGDATVAVLSDEEFQQLQFFLGIDALWRSCARDF